MHPKTAHVRNGGNLPGQPGQALVRGGQRITTAVDDFADALVATDIVQGLLPLLGAQVVVAIGKVTAEAVAAVHRAAARSEEHTSELQSRPHLVCRLLLEKKNTNT